MTANGKTGSKQFQETKTVMWKGTVEQFIPQIYKRALGGEGGKMLAFFKLLPLKMKFIFYLKKKSWHSNLKVVTFGHTPLVVQINTLISMEL